MSADGNTVTREEERWRICGGQYPSGQPLHTYVSVGDRYGDGVYLLSADLRRLYEQIGEVLSHVESLEKE